MRMVVRSGARILAALAVMVVMGAAEARGEPRLFRDYCTTGQIRACASVEIETTTIGGYTQVKIRAANHQGWATFPFANQASALFKISVNSQTYNFGAPDPASLTVGVIDPGASETGNAGDLWQVYESADQLRLRLTDDDDYEGAIFGCDTEEDDDTEGYFQTCDGGWVQFTFNTPYVWDANEADVEIEWKVSIDETIYSCTTGGAQGCVQTTVTPEPATIVLLASGLMVLGGAGVMRRRRRGGVDT